ncbi:MAG: cation diffusion facilitator family transporter [Bacteroidales bacterium]
MSSEHNHHQSIKNIRIAFFLNLAFTVFEFIGGYYVNSVAIISDAVHDLGDSLSLGTSWYLQKKSEKGATRSFTYGYGRFSLLGALINSIVLIGGSIFVVYKAVGRILEPEAANAQGMLIFAIVGVLVNGYAAWKLSSGKSINEQVISWHLLEDVLGWVAVLIVAIVLQFRDIHYLDPALSLLIILYVLWNVIKRLRKTLFIFLQGRPASINKENIEDEILSIRYVKSLHHTHLWSLEGENHVFTTHVKLKGISSLQQVKGVNDKIREIMKKYPFEHFTIQTELEDEFCEQEETE